jgi:hypothetical protein
MDNGRRNILPNKNKKKNYDKTYSLFRDESLILNKNKWLDAMDLVMKLKNLIFFKIFLS